VASFTISTVPWPAATTVDVFPALAWADPAMRPSGPNVASGPVTAQGTVTFTGLADQARDVAWAAGTGVRFATAPAGRQQPVAVPDRERIKSLEDQIGTGTGTGGGGGGGGGTGGTLELYTVDTNEHFKLIGLSDGTVKAIPFAVAAPVAPAGLAARVKITSALLTWNTIAGAARYLLSRDGILIASPTSNSYRDTTVVIGATYGYQVATVDGYGQRSPYSASVSAFIDGALNSAPTVHLRSWPATIATNGSTLLRVNAADVDAESLALALSVDTGNLLQTDDPSLWIVTV
jgi:hypothetical protein